MASAGLNLRRAAALIFALSSLLPLLLFVFYFGHFDLLQRAETQAALAAALLIAVLGYVIFQRTISRISGLAQALREVTPAAPRVSLEQTAIAGLGRIAEIGDIAQALAQLLDDLKTSTTRLEDLVFKLSTLDELVQLAARIPRIDELLGQVLERVMRGVRASIGSIMLLDPERQVLRVMAARGLPPDATRSETRVGEGVAGKVVELGEPVLVEDIETDPRFAKPNDPKYGTGSFICMPLKVGERTIGVVNLSRKDQTASIPGRRLAFSPTDLQFLNALMSYTAYAVENARLFEEARESARRLQQVVEDQKLRLTLAQQQMVQTAKLASLGELVAGVAHEVNSPLTVIVSGIEFLREEAPPSCGARLDAMAAAVESAQRIVKGLLTFSRRVPLERQPVELPDLVDRVLSLAAADLELAQIRVERQVEPGLPAIWADPHQLQQVLLNIVTNAKQALVAVTTDRRLSLSLQRAGADRVRLVVRDNGPGIAPDILPRIFDPFVSTKGPQGTGLGLSISYGIIREHGGDITVQSTPGAGATFAIELPVGAAPRTAAPAAREPAEPPPESRRTRILVIEDNALLREFVCTHLQRAGWDVLTAASAEEARRHLAARPDAVIMDYVLPGIDGLTFYRELAARHPQLARRCLVTTAGFLPDDVTSLSNEGLRLLPKPFTRQQLLDTVAELLGDESARPAATPSR